MSNNTNAPEKNTAKKPGFNGLVPIVLLVIGLVIMSVCYFNLNDDLTATKEALTAAEEKIAALEGGADVQPETEDEEAEPAVAPVDEETLAAKEAELTAANDALAAKEAELTAANDALAAKEAELTAANDTLTAKDTELVKAYEAVELAMKALNALTGAAEEPAPEAPAAEEVVDAAPAADVADEVPVAEETDPAADAGEIVE